MHPKDTHLPIEDPSFLRLLAIMIDTGLVGWKYYVPWADEFILTHHETPGWILELATTKYKPNAVKVIHNFLARNSSIIGSPSAITRSDDIRIACFLLRYRRGEISWATFLQQAGSASDGGDSSFDCEFFYEMLNRFEDSEFDANLIREQERAIERALSTATGIVESVYLLFLEYFRHGCMKT
ncbi:MAG TPA: hypothetical protein VHM90_04800 [Phycisphaerae bacterium]|nr:hypothetical protein [Phycisphaerae bacterium]